MNKPYAWINANNEFKIIFDDELPNAYPNAWIPVYTHDLDITDDEILDIWNAMPTETGGQIIDFVRAILKKAQENG